MDNISIASKKPKLKFWEIWNMSFGFLGIQFGFALQNANVSRIFDTLGAEKESLPILWLAAPVTGLVVQPIIGYYSDRTWIPKWGRRRPFFAVGAILATIALFIMPNSPSLWIAAGMLWIMDGSINVSMEPFRAFVGDMLPNEQRSKGFAMQAFFIGIGAVIASVLPYVLTNWLGFSNEAPDGQIPDSVKWSFYIGGVAFFSAVMWTVFNTKEYPPDDIEKLKLENSERGIFTGLAESFIGIFKMPKTMVQLAFVQFFSWFALFAMWIYTTPAVTEHVYGTLDTKSALYNEGANWVGIMFGVYNGVAALAAFLLPQLAKYFGRKGTHMLALFCGAAGLISVFYVNNPDLLVISMIGVGIAWASILSLPYAMLSSALPSDKMGYYMGVFNFFIVIPQIVAAGILGFILKYFFNNDTIYALVIGGISMILAGLLSLWVRDKDEEKISKF
ncbi:MFS transporter [Marivirga tractuosa]|uniref:Major facilitator superfamily MFS_1 n=1 Tax=Marivirga tractuosa (strain ATCC 23168 / DSM 4126 / NBRC 15989 / NCIMB 1408 / VKM B-1430 / H-43) TaxID=643867 RepID=E4TRZ0_MARTH|nr:MFS transporter [Marivirga tractuosa]ADR20741.1 major facilitator superfamily MFS_1 [Marivirga tractuosa DSM 4126]BDD14808.1 MFS transporter [Marivirga tractuosa]